MYAVIKTGGKQYRVAPGDTIRIERVEGKVGEKVTFGSVLSVHGDDKKLLTGADAAKGRCFRQNCRAGSRQEAHRSQFKKPISTRFSAATAELHRRRGQRHQAVSGTGILACAFFVGPAFRSWPFRKFERVGRIGCSRQDYFEG